LNQVLQIIKTTYYWNNLMQVAVGASSVPLLASAKIGLGTAAITPGPATTFADLMEATFTGYLESATIVWSPIVNETDGSQSSDAPSHLFRCTGASSVAVNNVFVTDGVGTASVGNPSTGILGSARLATPVNFINIGDSLNVNIEWNEGVVSPNSQAIASN
jgi:hypothetical protein